MTQVKRYQDQLSKVAAGDVAVVLEKDKQYGGSWLKRGGVGAYMMLARKWDRVEEFVERLHGCDILKAAHEDSRAEGVVDDIRDLRRYLLLVEAELVARDVVPVQSGVALPPRLVIQSQTTIDVSALDPLCRYEETGATTDKTMRCTLPARHSGQHVVALKHRPASTAHFCIATLQDHPSRRAYPVEHPHWAICGDTCRDEVGSWVCVLPPNHAGTDIVHAYAIWDSDERCEHRVGLARCRLDKQHLGPCSGVFVL